jgi:cytochrome P450
MFSFKYFDCYKKIKAAQSDATQAEGGSTFDLDQLGADSWRRRLFLRLWEWSLRIAFAFFRAFWPIPQFGRFVIVSRAADVTYVLKDPGAFNVPYGPEMEELAGGENFVLGMEGCEHEEQNAIIRRAIDAGDPALVAASSRQFARALINSSGGRIDVMKDLITRVASEACIHYFGIKVDDPDAFAEWTMSISALLFADPFGDPATRRLALTGAARVRAAIDRSIHGTKSHASNTLLARLIAAQASDPGLTDAKIRAILVGLVTGFIPTNTLAAGKILQELLRRRDAFDAAVAAAQAAEAFEKAKPRENNPHKEKLQAILFECARLNPALAPGQWRYAPKATSIKTSRGRTIAIANGSVLLVATMSALRDSTKSKGLPAIERPNSFLPDRKSSDIGLMFGDGTHECLGKYLAMAQITEVFQVLLSQKNLDVVRGDAGTMRWTGPFPRHLEMSFDSARPIATQQMLTICAPLKPGSTKQQLELLIAGLPQAGIKSALRKTGIVHFASLAVIEAGDAAKPNPFLILELNVDGTKEQAIRTIADLTQKQLGPIFDHTPCGGSNLAHALTSYALDLKARPWGATGLNFKGTGEFSVADIKMQQRLAVFTRKALALFIETHAGLGSRAMPAVRFVRDLILQHPRYMNAAKAGGPYGKRVAKLLRSGAVFRDHLALPGGRRLLISDWKDRTHEDALYDFLKSRDFAWIAVPFLAIALVMSIGIYVAIGFSAWFGLPGQILISATGGVVSAAMLAIVIAALFVLALRYYERTSQTRGRSRSGRTREPPGLRAKPLHGGDGAEKARLVPQAHARPVALGHRATHQPRLSPRLRPKHGHDPLRQVVSSAEDGQAHLPVELRRQLGELSRRFHHEGAPRPDRGLEQRRRFPENEPVDLRRSQRRRPLQALGPPPTGSDAVLVQPLS